MNLFPLTGEDKNRLKVLNNDKASIFALKKLFLNVCISDPPSNESIKKITDAFHQLSVITPDNQIREKEENLV